MTTPHDVVADYLRNKHERDKPQRQRDRVGLHTAEIVDELPDGFTANDVHACVAVLVEHDPELEGFDGRKRGQVIRKTLADMVADDALKLEGKLYFHKGL